MKSKILIGMAAIVAVATLTIPRTVVAQGAEPTAHAEYLVFELGTLGGTGSGASAINDRGWAMGPQIWPATPPPMPRSGFMAGRTTSAHWEDPTAPCPGLQ